jgi:hypothetical protein
VDLASAGDRSPPARPRAKRLAVGKRTFSDRPIVTINAPESMSGASWRASTRAGLTMLTIGGLVVVMDLHQHGVDFVSGLRRSMSFNGPSLPPQLGDGSFPSTGYAFCCCAESL